MAGAHADAPVSAPAAIVVVPRERIRPMPGQPREYFDRGDLELLAGSLAALGQVVPVLAARVTGDRGHDYELIDGQRRWHAAQIAGIPTLRVEVVEEPDPEKRYARSVAANLHRKGHHPMEIALACARLRKTMSVEAVAELIGYTASHTCNHLSLLNLHPDVREALHPTVPKERRLPFVVAVKLARLTHEAQRQKLAEIQSASVSPARAAVWALADVPAAATLSGRGPRARKPYDQSRVLLAQIRRFAHDLDQHPPELIRNLCRSRPHDADAVRSGLRKLIAVASERLEAAEKGGGE